MPDGGPISFGGYRFGSEFWIDLGHPDAATYTVEVLLHLVHHYDLDGLHLDRIRYPELSVSGQTPSTGASIGYNPRLGHLAPQHRDLVAQHQQLGILGCQAPRQQRWLP